MQLAFRFGQTRAASVQTHERGNALRARGPCMIEIKIRIVRGRVSGKRSLRQWAQERLFRQGSERGNHFLRLHSSEVG